MSWFKNLKKWQKGALIGCAVGVIFVCLLGYACIVNDTPRGIDWGQPGGAIKFWILLLHSWLALPSFWLSSILSKYDDPGAWTLLGVTLLIFYWGLGAIVGRVQQIIKPVWKWLLTTLLAPFLILFYVSSFLLVVSSYNP